MKTLLLTILFFSHLMADYKEFGKEYHYELEYQQALKKAKEEKKDIILLMVSNFCPWCQKLEKVVLSKKELNAQIHKKYIPLILNKDAGDFPKAFETPMVPTVYFVDFQDEKIKKKVVGYNNRIDLINIINEKGTK